MPLHTGRPDVLRRAFWQPIVVGCKRIMVLQAADIAVRRFSSPLVRVELIGITIELVRVEVEGVELIWDGKLRLGLMQIIELVLVEVILVGLQMRVELMMRVGLIPVGPQRSIPPCASRFRVHGKLEIRRSVVQVAQAVCEGG